MVDAYAERVGQQSDESDTAPPVLSIGASVGGVTQRPRQWGDAVMALARRVKAQRAGTESPLNVNVVYHVPGEVVSLDWEGVRIGRYDANARHLMVQATVPDEPPLDAESILLDRLTQAIREAERWASRKGIASDLASLHAVTERLKRS